MNTTEETCKNRRNHVAMMRLLARLFITHGEYFSHRQLGTKTLKNPFVISDKLVNLTRWFNIYIFITLSKL